MSARMYYVFHDDDYADNGGIGFQEFPSLDEACCFIEGRLKQNAAADLNGYVLIEGVKLSMESVDRVVTITVPGRIR